MQIDIIQLKFIDIKLRKLLVWLEEATGLTFTETSIYRENDPGVHGTMPVRGTDLRCRDFNIGKAIEKFINTHWQYNPKRLNKRCAKLHDEGPNMHLHIQVHPDTIFLGRS